MTGIAADPQSALADAKRRELMRRELARRHMIDFVRYVTPWYQDAGFRTALCDVLDAFARRQILRLKITVPPQHGKSFLVSEHLPAFLLGREPDSRVMLGSYNQRFANKWGRAVQRIMRRPAYAALFPGSKIGSGSGYTAAVDEFDIQDRRGGFKAVGFGAGITGNPFHYGIIDDPIKGRSEADSAVVRENIWDTYTGEFYTRQNPMGAAPICLMSCMVGGTVVLMGDGSEKFLRDVRVGDSVATFKDGRLGASRVLNWKNNGADKILRIKTISGITVRSNGRHPFLVRVGGALEWIRAKDLRQGYEIVRVNGANGRTRSARLRDVASQLGAEDIATATTTKSVGLTAFGRHLALKTHRQELTQNSNTATALLLPTISGILSGREAIALFAGENQIPPAIQKVGLECCALITATKAERFADCFATDATSPLAAGIRQKRSMPPLDTSDFTLDAVAEIRHDGVEDVFDVQVEGTENFIANGLVSHNTRWHDDDPHGRTDRQERAGGEKWTVFNFPAIDKQGRPLLFSAEAYAKVKFTLGSRDWQSLYQQEPMLEGGTVFKERWFRRYVLDRATLPESVRGGWCVSERPSESPDGKLGAVTVHRIDAGSLMRFITVDPALTEKESADYSVVDVWGYDSDRGDLYLLDHWRDQVSSPDLLDKIGQQLNLWRCVRVYVESVAFQKSLIQFADRLDWPVTELVADRDKLARAYAAAPLVEQGRVYVPTSAEWWPVLQHELLTFPQSDRKDQVDSFAYGCLVIREGLGGATIGPTAGSDPGPTGGRLNPHRYAQRWQAGGGRRFSAR